MKVFIFLLVLLSELCLLTRAQRVDYCPINYCEGGLMQAQCSPIGPCGSERTIPFYWFNIVTQSYETDFPLHPPLRRLITNYYHHENANLDCLPCCQLTSFHPKIPSKIF